MREIAIGLRKRYTLIDKKREILFLLARLPQIAIGLQSGGFNRGNSNRIVFSSV